MKGKVPLDVKTLDQTFVKTCYQILDDNWKTFTSIWGQWKSRSLGPCPECNAVNKTLSATVLLYAFVCVFKLCTFTVISDMKWI